MGFLLLWLFGCFFVGFVFGTARTIGFWGSFVISLILSPLLGLIITLFSKTKAEDNRQKEMLDLQKQNLELQKKLLNKE